jgi:hypothetical protein
LKRIFKVFLLEDNVPGYPSTLMHNEINVAFFPANKIFILQLMDQGVFFFSFGGYCGWLVVLPALFVCVFFVLEFELCLTLARQVP